MREIMMDLIRFCTIDSQEIMNDSCQDIIIIIIDCKHDSYSSHSRSCNLNSRRGSTNKTIRRTGCGRLDKEV